MSKKITVVQYQAKIKKGLSLLTPASIELFKSFEAAYPKPRGKRAKPDYIAIYEHVATLYRAQSDEASIAKYDFSTMTFAEKARFRAARIREATGLVKQAIRSKASSSVIATARNKVAAAIASRTE